MLLLGSHQSMCLAWHADHWCCLQTPHQTLPPVKEGAQWPKCIQRRFIAGAGHAANATHLPRKLNASSWAPDDDLYWCQWGLLPTKCLVWQAQCQLIKIHATTVYSEQGTRGSVSPDPSSHWYHGSHGGVQMRLVWSTLYQTHIKLASFSISLTKRMKQAMLC